MSNDDDNPVDYLQRAFVRAEKSKWHSKVMIPNDVEKHIRTYHFHSSTLSIVHVSSGSVLVTLYGCLDEEAGHE